MAKFSTHQLVDGGTLVEGTDDAGVVGSVILFDSGWSAYQAHTAHSAAMDEYDEAVRKFFKPLTKAADAVRSGAKKDWSSITIEEPVEGKQGSGIFLGPDGVILRIIAETDGSSLRWVNGRLVALA